MSNSILEKKGVSMRSCLACVARGQRLVLKIRLKNNYFHLMWDFRFFQLVLTNYNFGIFIAGTFWSVITKPLFFMLSLFLTAWNFIVKRLRIKVLLLLKLKIENIFFFRDTFFHYEIVELLTDVEKKMLSLCRKRWTDMTDQFSKVNNVSEDI